MAVKDIVVVMEQRNLSAIRASIGDGTVILEQDGNRIVLDAAPESIREFLSGVTVAVTAARQVREPLRMPRKGV